MVIASCFRAVVSFGLLLSTVSWATVDQPGTLDPTFAVGSLYGSGRVMKDMGGLDDGANAVVVQVDGKLVLAGSCLGAFCALRYNANGTIDTTFGVDGKVITAIGVATASANALAVQPDGKLVLVGGCRGTTINTNFCAVRLNSNGSLDTTFGTGGKVITWVVGSNSASYGGFANAVALQPDGKLVLAGQCVGLTGYDNFCAIRYNAIGTPDTTFGTNGEVITAVGADSSSSRASALALQSDGKLVLAGGGACAGSVFTTEFCALRYNANGTLDTTFGTNGTLITPARSLYDHAWAIVIQPDGKLVLAGVCTLEFCVRRYSSNGTLDTSFGIGGYATTPNNLNNAERAVAVIQPDGKLVLAGSCGYDPSPVFPQAPTQEFCVFRLHINGTVDTGFGTNGTSGTDFSLGHDYVRAITLQVDGKLVIAGRCQNGLSDTDFCAARYDGGPFGYKACSLDIDGDNRVLATTDSLIHTRIALGITGPAVVNGITFPPTATRNTWPLIRDYLVMHCGMSLVP